MMRLEETMDYLTTCEICGGPLYNGDELAAGECQECSEWAHYWTYKMLSDPKVLRDMARRMDRFDSR